MGRRRTDWIQLALLLVTLLTIAVHLESRLARIEQHLIDVDQALVVIDGRLTPTHPTSDP